jgi:glutamate synthase (NADPH/NADH) large chain
VILGPVGSNFGAGMTGGMAFLHDPEAALPAHINPDAVIYQRVETAHWEGVLRDLIAEHVRETQSRFAEQLLIDWRHEKHHFWQIVPKEMLERLDHPLHPEAEVEKRA